jgi:fatty-acyl-CoA synthase
MTESSPLITLNSIDDTFENRTETIGKAIEHIEIKVVDTNGRAVPIGQPGELLVRGFNTMIGYWDDEAKTKEVYTSDRFLKTG